jgi:hypothetical protein
MAAVSVSVPGLVSSVQRVRGDRLRHAVAIARVSLDPGICSAGSPDALSVLEARG